MKALRLFTLALTLALTPALVCSAYAQDDDDTTEQTDSSTPKKKKSKKKDKAKSKKKAKKKAGPFKMEKKGFAKVFEKAKEANVPVMVLFTNPPTCPYCVKLEKEVLNNSQWKKAVNGRIMCIYVDNACKDPMAQELTAKFPHQGIPTFVMVDPHTMEALGPCGGYVSSDPIQSCIRNVDYACNAMKEAHPDDAEEEPEEETEE